MLADPGHVPAEIERIKQAVASSIIELEAIVTKVAQQLGMPKPNIFQSHLQIVNDPALLAEVHELIEVQHLKRSRRWIWSCKATWRHSPRSSTITTASGWPTSAT